MSSNRTVLISINTSWNLYHFRAPLIHVLKSAGYTVITAAPEDAYTPRLRTLVDGHVELPMSNAGTSPIQDIALFLRYVRLLRRVKPAILLTYTIKPNIYGALAARLLGIPIIANVSGLGTAFIRNDWLTRVVKLLYRYAFAGATSVFFQNPEDCDLFLQLKLVRPERTALLAGSGIDLDYYRPEPQPREADAPVAFVLIARLLWDKGIGEYMEAARIVKAANPHVIFRLVGFRDVANRTAIPASIIDGWAAEGHVEYLGETEDVRRIITQHDCVVLPSYREGLSRVLLEGAAMGKPLIASDVAGCRQVVEHGKNGFLCKPRDAKDLAETLMTFLSLSLEERNTMGAASRSKAEETFDQKHVLQAYVARIAALTPDP